VATLATEIDRDAIHATSSTPTPGADSRQFWARMREL
jgi:hypothetical protein